MHSHDHNHGHSCDHDHGHHHHGHSHAPANFGKAFLIGIVLNSLFVLAEVIYGFRANSLALLADAGHNASDVLGLFMAWGAILASGRKPTARYTYGLQSSSILAALANAIFLLLVTGGIVLEAVQRFFQAEPVTGTTVMAVAAIGIIVNGATALLFMKGKKDDLNVRAAYLHMAADAAVAAGVVVSGAAIMLTGWLWLDPAVGIVIGLIIIAGTWSLLRDSFNLALHAVPSHIDPIKVKEYLEQVKGVKGVHDLHIWAMSTNQAALSAHLLMPAGHPGDAFIREVAHELEEDFRIGHATIQIELGDENSECPLAPDDVI